MLQFLSRLYLAVRHPRSPHWPHVRAEFLAKHPECAASGTTENLEVHHVKPYHLFPELELDPANLITLSEKSPQGVNWHLKLGHLGNWSKWNPDVRHDAAAMLARLKNRPTPPPPPPKNSI